MNIHTTLKTGRIIFDQAYPILERVLSNYHKTNKSNFDWYVLICFWLNALIFYYLQHYYNKSITDYSKLKKKSFINNDYSDFEKLLQNHDFNFFFLSVINQKKKNLNSLFNHFIGNNIQYDFKQKYLIFLKKLIWKTMNFFFKTSLFSNFSVNKNILFKFFLNTRCKLLSIVFFSKKNYTNKKNIDKNVRIKLYQEFNKIKSFKKYPNFTEIIFLFMPFSFIENFKFYKDNISDLIRFNPPIVFLDGPEVYNEPFKILLGYWVKRRTQIFNIQHSSNHIDLKNHSFYDYWFKYSNLYISWGWKNKSKKTISLPSLRLFNMVSRFKKKKVNLIYDIVFFPRVNFLFPHFSLHLNQNIQIDNFKATENLINYFKKNKSKLFIKSRDEDENRMNYKQYILNSSYNTQEIFFKTKLSVFNHFSTGFFECLFLDRPAVIYIPNKDHLIKESSSYIELNNILKKYGLICSKPSDISKLFNKINTNFFLNIYNSLKSDNLFKKQILNPSSSDLDWMKFFKKIL